MNADAGPATRERVRQGADAYAQVLAQAGGQELQALVREGGQAAVCAALYASPPYDLLVPSLAVSRLSVNLTPARVQGGIVGETRRSYEALRYSMFMAPAGVAAVWRKDLPSRHLNIYFHADVLDDIGAAAFGQRGPLHNIRMAGIRPLADQLAAELGSADPMKAEASDSLARLILVRLARQLCAGDSSANPLTPALLARLRDYVNAHLSERILVADLAREAGLSPNHFARVFAEQTRRSPHQFVLSLRLDRAEQLLRASTLSLVDVAHDCGFANQQHLSNAMRRHLGTTPSRYRKAHAPGERR